MVSFLFPFPRFPLPFFASIIYFHEHTLQLLVISICILIYNLQVLNTVYCYNNRFCWSLPQVELKSLILSPLWLGLVSFCSFISHFVFLSHLFNGTSIQVLSTISNDYCTDRSTKIKISSPLSVLLNENEPKQLES